MAQSRVEISARELEPPQNARAQDRPLPVGHLLGRRPSLFGRRTRPLDEAEVRLGEGSEANYEPDLVLDPWVELVRLVGEVERQLPVSREPLDPGMGGANLRAQAFVPAGCGLCSDLVEQRASSIQLSLAGQAPAERHGRTLVVLQL